MTDDPPPDKPGITPEARAFLRQQRFATRIDYTLTTILGSDGVTKAFAANVPPKLWSQVFQMGVMWGLKSPVQAAAFMKSLEEELDRPLTRFESALGGYRLANVVAMLNASLITDPFEPGNERPMKPKLIVPEHMRNRL